MAETVRHTLFLGHFGSGKTELAINRALASARQGTATALVDLDVVTPFFRSRDARRVLEATGVDLVAPATGFDQADLPILPMSLDRVLGNPNLHTLVDVGGDEGARALAGLRRFFQPGQYEALLVVNPRRPQTATIEAVLAFRQWLEGMSGLTITALVANGNLAMASTAAQALEDYQLVQRVAATAGLAVAALAVAEHLVSEIPAAAVSSPIWPLHRYMLTPWEAGAGSPDV
ncbi:MAG: hypothetical protein ACYC5Y_00260 [Symbiobacteriia bacterium]